VFTGITLSLVIGVPAGTLLGGALGYRGVSAVIGGLCVLGAVGLRLTLPTVPPPPRIGVRARFAVAADPAVLVMLGILVLGLLGWSAGWSSTGSAGRAGAGRGADLGRGAGAAGCGAPSGARPRRRAEKATRS
jgi:hypothetical protein